MNHWLAKSEPEAYSWAQLVKDGRTAWTGVRNFQARNNLRAADHVFPPTPTTIRFSQKLASNWMRKVMRKSTSPNSIRALR